MYILEKNWVDKDLKKIKAEIDQLLFTPDRDEIQQNLLLSLMSKQDSLLDYKILHSHHSN